MLNANRAGQVLSKHNCFLMSLCCDMYINHLRNMTQTFVVNSTNATEGSTNERTYERKDENYRPIGINTWVIKIYENDSLFCPRLSRGKKVRTRTLST